MAVTTPPTSPFTDGDFTLRPASELPTRIDWAAGPLRVALACGPDSPVVLGALTGDDEPVALRAATQPLVELLVAGDGRARGTTRFTNTAAGARLRLVDSAEDVLADPAGDVHRLRVVQRDDALGLLVTTVLTASGTVPALRATTTVRNEGGAAVVVEALTSLALGALVAPGEDTRDLDVSSATGEQLAENRWSTRAVWSQDVLADFNSTFHDQPGRGAFEVVGTSTWSTGRALPVGVLANRRTGRGFAWQVEHNGGWRWELDNVREGEDSLALLLMGPEDLDHHAAQRLAPGEELTSVPVSVAVGTAGFAGAVGQLHRHRRWLRRHRSADRAQVLVYNDFMNTLDGDPTTERVLPLVAAAAEVGAECFCVDAGWYDDAGYWWPSVGEWEPSTRRFPDGGLARVLDEVHARGMRRGLWVEPEVVGVRSPVATRLPDAAFLQRHGHRVVEQERYFLDLRHPAARAHLDATFDRLVADFGVEYFKLDYNVTPGTGTDHDAFSPGAGLLAHNRAHLAWFEALRERHPDVVFENCSSGAMRADFAMLERFDLQSTSDQMDFRLYPAVAAGAVAHLLPEQAGNWAYPQAHMDDEEIAFTLVTGLSGRLYLSGFLDAMDDAQRDLVARGAALHKEVRHDVAAALPSWPLGLPDWYADTLALRLTAPGRDLLLVWRREPSGAPVTLDLGVPASALRPLYPLDLPAWGVTDGADGGVVLHPAAHRSTARVFDVRP